MSGERFKWIEYPVSGERAETLRPFFAVSDYEPNQQPVVPLPDLSHLPTAKEKVLLLLHYAAEIEHALMAQYLYAAYSLKSAGELEDQQHKTAVTAWRLVVAGIAREEMGHLMTVQNLLLLLGMPLNFQREDMPPPPDIYPFPLVLTRLTQTTLARYIVAESPYEAEGIESIIDLAMGGGAMPINRVGILYALLGLTFYTEEQVWAPTDDPWKLFVQKVAEAAYQQQEPKAWHLPNEAFDPTTVPQQATDAEWAPQAAIRVFTAGTRDEAVAALRDIGLQGEGPSAPDPSGSHFERFHKIFTGSGGILPFPADGEWEPTVDVPTMPVVTNDPSLPNGISHPNTRRWAELADARYALLLGELEQFLLTPRDKRAFLKDWSLRDMRYLRGLSGELVKQSRSATGDGKAALPLTLPKVLPLPADPSEQWALYRERLEACVGIAESIIAAEGPKPFLETMVNDDRQRLQGVPTIIERGAVRTRFDEVRAILDAATGDAIPFHDGLERFWHQPLADFLAKPVYGLKIVENEGDDRGARSALVKALRGEAPFDGSFFDRMPLGHPPVPDEQIAVIVRWIDDGCPEDPI